MGHVIGIDLGTTNSCVSVVDGGKPVVIPNTGGYKTSPSMFAVSPDGKRLVGHLAKRQAITNARGTVYAAKRLIGRRFDEPEVATATELVPYEIVQGPNNDPCFTVGGKSFTCTEISAIILREMKSVAEEYLGEPVSQAVITVPAYFNDTQRQCTKDAGKIAGLDVLRIINEPTAAALAYGVGEQKEEKIAVYDLGGGTFDVSILEIGEGVVEVLATAGNTFLGGEDFDQRLVEYVLEEVEKNEGLDLRGDLMALQRLKDAAEKAKCDLSTLNITEINLPFIANDSSGPRHLNLDLTRETLENLVIDIVNSSLETVDNCVKQTGLAPGDIDHVVLVGGQTRMPLVQNAVYEYFGKRPHKGVNPDEVVATGAAIQGDVLVSEERDLLLLDVTPLDLGIATYDGGMAPLIKQNTTIPAVEAHSFTTTRDNQSAVKIRVLQGMDGRSAENHLLGEFVLSEIPPAVAGDPDIEVTFDIDANGIVNVSARDVATDTHQSITVDAAGTLSEDEIESIMREHEAHELPRTQ
ncbi:MAG: molecular chaperone DnaK [Myxococcales bacterium]|nr:molecular chaperone DnaK [Myxococcales bacterium]